MLNSNLDSSSWRPINTLRPWYQKALNLLPDLSQSKVLELGSGHGEFAKLISHQTKSFICSDYSKAYVNKLKKAGLTGIQADFNQKLPFKSNQYDLIITLEVIEHLYNAEGFLKEVKRILKPKGNLIISTPNIAWWGYRLFSLIGQPPKKEGYHLRFFTHHTLINLLNRSGFKVIKANSFTTIPLLNRVLPKPIYPTINFWPNLLAQDLIFLC